MTDLPTPAEMIQRAAAELDNATRALAAALDELRSDWPAGTRPTGPESEAIAALREAAREARILIEQGQRIARRVPPPHPGPWCLVEGLDDTRVTPASTVRIGDQVATVPERGINNIGMFWHRVVAAVHTLGYDPVPGASDTFTTPAPNTIRFAVTRRADQ